MGSAAAFLRPVEAFMERWLFLRRDRGEVATDFSGGISYTLA